MRGEMKMMRMITMAVLLVSTCVFLMGSEMAGCTAPRIFEINPEVADVGSPVVITGVGFGRTQATSKVFFYPNVDAGLTSSWSDTQITIDSPLDAKSGYVYTVIESVYSNPVNIDVVIPEEMVGFYSINSLADELVLIDTLRHVTPIGSLGIDVGTTHTGGMDIDSKGNLWLITYDYEIEKNFLYLIDKTTGLASQIVEIYDPLDPEIIVGDISFDTFDVLYVHDERSGTPQGTLKTLNMTTGELTAVSEHTTGDTNIFAIEFDHDNMLWAASASTDRLLILNSTTGQISWTPSIGMDLNFTSGLTTTPDGTLWGMDIDDYVSPTMTNIFKVDPGSATCRLMFTLDDAYTTIAGTILH